MKRVGLVIDSGAKSQLPSSDILRRLLRLLAKSMDCYFRIKEFGFSSLYLSWK
jgi:hypothetical protein